VAFLIPGVISLFSFFGRKRSEHEPAPRFPIEGIGSLLFGLWLIVMPEFFADVLMFLLGFILIMGGVQQIASLSMARRWTPVPGIFLSGAFIDSYRRCYCAVQSYGST